MTLNATRGLRCLLLVHDLSENQAGRAYSNWLLGKELGWEMRTAGEASAGLWYPLLGTGFEDQCHLSGGAPDEDPVVREAARWADLIIATKPLPRSLGAALRFRRSVGTAVLADLDDDDLEAVRSVARGPVGLIRGQLLRKRGLSVGAVRRLTATACRHPRITSNPELQKKFGGVVVPHVRPVPSSVVVRDEQQLSVAFVGTPRKHKGIEALRAAVAALAPTGFRLVVTAEAPRDARPWEDWVGETTLKGGNELLDCADIVAVPSLDTPYTRTQLPVKLIDAMALGRSVVASDLPVLRWALGDGGGVFVRAGDTAALTYGLDQLRDPRRRRQVVAFAHGRAMDLFAPPAVSGRFEMAAIAALDVRRPPAADDA